MRADEAKDAVTDGMRLLDAVAETLTRATGEVQLPLHILLENHFGDLNENQEELLQAASAAADRIDLASRQLRRILDLEHGRITFQREAVRLVDVLQPVLAIAAARGEARGVRVAFDPPPVSPFVVADRYFLGEALTALFAAVGDGAEGATELRVALTSDESRVGIRVDYAGAAPAGLEMATAARLVRAQQGEVAVAVGAVTITLRASSVGGGF